MNLQLGMLHGDVAVVALSRLSKRLNVIKKVCPWFPTQNADGTAKNALDVKDNIYGR